MEICPAVVELLRSERGGCRCKLNVNVSMWVAQLGGFVLNQMQTKGLLTVAELDTQVTHSRSLTISLRLRDLSTNYGSIICTHFTSG